MVAVAVSTDCGSVVGVLGKAVGEGAVVGTTGVGGGVAVWQPKRKIRKIVTSRVLFIDQSPTHLL
jgi:hypothetical protein